jgi:benzoylformate decarboxylase
VPGLDKPGLDFVALAKGYGCSRERITVPEGLKDAIAQPIELDQPHLIEVEVDPTVPPLI